VVGTPLRVDRAMVRFLSNNPKLDSVTDIFIVTLNRHLIPIPTDPCRRQMTLTE
jgi:hypothetical protein